MSELSAYPAIGVLMLDSGRSVLFYDQSSTREILHQTITEQLKRALSSETETTSMTNRILMRQTSWSQAHYTIQKITSPHPQNTSQQYLLIISEHTPDCIIFIFICECAVKQRRQDWSLKYLNALSFVHSWYSSIQ